MKKYYLDLNGYFDSIKPYTEKELKEVLKESECESFYYDDMLGNNVYLCKNKPIGSIKRSMVWKELKK